MRELSCGRRPLTCIQSIPMSLWLTILYSQCFKTATRYLTQIHDVINSVPSVSSPLCSQELECSAKCNLRSNVFFISDCEENLTVNKSRILSCGQDSPLARSPGAWLPEAYHQYKSAVFGNSVSFFGGYIERTRMCSLRRALPAAR